MKIGSSFKLDDAKIAKEDVRYVVKDNDTLNNLVVSTTKLQPSRQTNGHSHAGQEEVYIFTQGSGRILIDDEITDVSASDTVLIKDGAFHRVFNESSEILEFAAIFNGERHTEDKPN